MLTPTQRDREPRRTHWAALATVAVVAAALYASLTIGGLNLRSFDVAGAVGFAPQQDAQEEGPDEPEVPPDQVQKYINVYRAMQRDHSLTVEQAASRQGMSVGAFRELESKVERDDLVREHVRQALANKSSDSSAPSPAR
jgi:hypothetical protein